MDPLDLNHKETIENLIRKSGFKTKVDDKLFHKIEVTRFQSHKSSMEVSNYIQIRNNINESA